MLIRIALQIETYSVVYKRVLQWSSDNFILKMWTNNMDKYEMLRLFFSSVAKKSAPANNISIEIKKKLKRFDFVITKITLQYYCPILEL